jgi:hypothetical protein
MHLTAFFAAARAVTGARKPPSTEFRPSRQFWLEREPMPATLPGQTLGGTPGVVYARSTDQPPAVGNWGRDDDGVQHLVADGPGDPPEDLSDLTPPDDDRSPEAVRARAQAVIARVPEKLRGPTPLADELRRDWQLLNDANGRLVDRLRALEAQLREHGIEPVRVE